MRYINLYVDHPKAGFGLRSFFVVHEGKKQTRLFSPFDAHSYTLANKDIRKPKEIEIPTRRDAAQIAGIIRDNYRQRKRLHLAVSGKDAKAVMDDLKGRRAA